MNLNHDEAGNIVSLYNFIQFSQIPSHYVHTEDAYWPNAAFITLVNNLTCKTLVLQVRLELITSAGYCLTSTAC